MSVVLPVLLLFSGMAWVVLPADPFSLEGIHDGAVLGAAAAGDAQLLVRFASPPVPSKVEATLDGEPVGLAFDPAGAAAVIEVGVLTEGPHDIAVIRRRLLGADRQSVSFTVDATPPSLEVVDPTGPVPVAKPVTVEVAVDDPKTSVELDGRPVVVTDGVARATFPTPPIAPLQLSATDQAGNTTMTKLKVVLALPGAPGQAPIRGVHASGYTWSTPELKDPIMEMIQQGKINTVEIDLKDEGGDIWYDTSVGLAHEIGAVTVLWDLKAVVDELHGLGVRVVGRLVNFRDPRLAAYAVSSGRMEMVVQNPDGTAFGKYGGFTNPFDRDVWEYNISLAEEATRLGVDDILYDYVRRPDDYIENMRFPGAQGTPEDAIVAFLDESRDRIHAAGGRLGASVFGIAATRPDEVAQDIPRMSQVVDYVAPMTYPSHWGPGEYGVKNPNASPYDIVFRSLTDFHQKMAGTDAQLMVWIQDFSLGIEYGPAEVRAQIQAAADAGVDSFFLWDAAATYTAAALDP